MYSLFNRPGLPLCKIIKITLFICLFFILESKQHQNDWIDRPQHKRQTESQHFIDDEVDPRRMSVPTSEEQMLNNGIDPLDRVLSRRKRRITSKDDEEGEDVDTSKIEERVDPNTRTERLELDKSWLRRTTFTQNKSPLAKYVMKECGVAKKLTQRVVGGQDAEDGVYPWAVAVLKQGDGWCGGSILNEYWIITASHCFMNTQDPREFAVRVGSVDRNRGATYKVKKLIMHERFHLDNMFNSDIALLKLDKPIKFGDFVNSICIPNTLFEEPQTPQLTVTGWGALKYESRDTPVIMQEVTLDRISDGACAKRYQARKNTIYRSQVCTWTAKKDACQGDSGGPAIEMQSGKAFLIGVVSYGAKCADEFPGVYTQVSYFLNWIKEKIEEEEGAKGSSKVEANDA